jgi:hypothetical protein
MVKFDKFQTSLVKLSGSSSVDALINEIVNYINQSIKKISPDKIDPSLLELYVILLKIHILKNVLQIIKLIKRKLLLMYILS